MSSYKDAVAKSFIIDQEIKDHIIKEERDFRLCTTCSGPVLIPVDIVPSKPSDIEIRIGDNSLFISSTLARFTRRVHKSLLDHQNWMWEDRSNCHLD